MFPIFDRPTRLCDGLSRRELLRVGGLSAVGLALPQLLAAREQPPEGIIKDPTFGRAKNIIFVWLQGGPPQHETFDPKPHAPIEIRGPFKPIATNVPGMDFCELLPRTARIADKLAVVRSLATDNNIHSASGYEVLTGYKYRGPNARTISPTDWPFFGSIVKLLKPSETLPPLSSVWIPRKMHLNENVMPAGQTAGFLGSQWDPDRFEVDPSDPNDRVEGLDLLGIPPARLQRRVSLLEQMDGLSRHVERHSDVGVYNTFQEQALDILTSGKVKKAFAVDREPDKVRDRYGRNKWGQCLLLARRLVEAGARMVHVNWAREPGDSAVDNPMWDTHALNADRVEDVLCPIFDVGFTALIEDLDQRGLLSETLVVAIGEFGRTPKINDRGGRDHWGAVFSFALAGAGVQTAQIYGASDKIGGHPAQDRVSCADLTATIFHSVGISHKAKFNDPEHREHYVTTGEPLRALLGGGTAADTLQEPGGSISRVPAYTGELLLNTEFDADVPLRAADFGSRPKGWRAAPLTGGLVARIIRNSSSPKESYAEIGIGLDATEPLEIAPGPSAVLGQEMRSPRLGTFEFTVEATGAGSSKDFFEDTFRKNFACRLVIFRYKELTKDPRHREEFISQPIEPKFATESQTFQITKVLDSTKPGQNFPIGKGFGVAIIVERTGSEALTIPAGAWAALRVQRVGLEFRSRTINEKVKV